MLLSVSPGAMPGAGEAGLSHSFKIMDVALPAGRETEGARKQVRHEELLPHNGPHLG